MAKTLCSHFYIVYIVIILITKYQCQELCHDFTIMHILLIHILYRYIFRKRRFKILFETYLLYLFKQQYLQVKSVFFFFLKLIVCFKVVDIDVWQIFRNTVRHSLSKWKWCLNVYFSVNSNLSVLSVCCLVHWCRLIKAHSAVCLSKSS